MEIFTLFNFYGCFILIFLFFTTRTDSYQSYLWRNVLKSDDLHVYRQTNRVQGKLRELYMVRSKPTGADYLKRMVDRKKVEVDNLLRKHQEPDDPLVMRMTYMASQCQFNITNALKREAFGKDNLHTMSIIVDMKRRSPTVPRQRNIVEYSNAPKFAELLTLSGVDGLLINTEELEYGGKYEELKASVKASKAVRPNNPLACIHKDIIIHPAQIAQALLDGASGVLVIAAVVGADLEVLLDACTIMGTEAIVEVHTPNELEFALSKGATIFLVNMWDRLTGELFPNQAKGLISMMPMNAVAIAAGNIKDLSQVYELGLYGYDGIVLGRGITEIPDIKGFIDDVHQFLGMPRNPAANFGMKGPSWDPA